MADFGVDWGGASSQGMANGGASLGEALGRMIGGGQGYAAQWRTALAQEQLNKARLDQDHVRQTMDLQKQAAEREAAAQAVVNSANQQKIDLANVSRQQAADAAQAKYDYLEQKYHPAGLGVLARNDPAIVEYDTMTNPSVLADLRYAYGTGDGSPESRASGINKVYGGILTQATDPNTQVRGRTMLGQNLDVMAGKDGPVPINPDGSALKPIIQNGQSIVRVPATEQNPSGLQAYDIPGVVKAQKPLEAGPGTARMRTRALINAEQILSTVNAPTDAPDVVQHLMNQPSDEAVLKTLKEYNKDPRYRTFLTAASNYITEVLRDESGAAIGSPEFWRRASELIPFNTDTPELLNYKKTERTNKIFGNMDKGWAPDDQERRALEDDLEKQGRGRKTRDYRPGVSNGGNGGGGANGGGNGGGGPKRWSVGADGSVN